MADAISLNDVRPFFIRTESARRQPIPPLKAYKPSSASEGGTIGQQSSREYAEWVKDNEEDAWVRVIRMQAVMGNGKLIDLSSMACV